MATSGYWGALRRQWRLVAIVVLVAVGAALVTTFAQDKRYRSTTRVIVSGPGEMSRSLTAVLATQAADVVRSPRARAAAAASADLSANPRVELSHPSVSASASGPLLSITVTADSADAARTLAAAYPVVLPEQFAVVNPRSLTFNVVEPANRPSSPTEPRPLRNILLGLLGGVVLGGAAAAVRASGRGRRRPAVVDEPPDEPLMPISEATLLGVIPHEHPEDRLVLATQPSSVRAWEYGALVGALDAVHGDQPLRSLLVASALPRDGRSTFVANLSLAISRTGRRVVAIDADLRGPALAAAFNLAAEPGLSEVLNGQAELASVLRAIPDSRLSVLPGGAAVPEPDSLLAWPAMQRIVQELLNTFDVVVVDAPPVAGGADVLMFGAIADGLVLLARPGRGAKEGLRSAVATISHTPVRLLGVIANGVEVAPVVSEPVASPVAESVMAEGASVIAEEPAVMVEETVAEELPAAEDEAVVERESAAEDGTPVAEDETVAEEPDAVEEVDDKVPDVVQDEAVDGEPDAVQDEAAEESAAQEPAVGEESDLMDDDLLPFVLDELFAESEPHAREPVAVMHDSVAPVESGNGEHAHGTGRPRFLPPPAGVPRIHTSASASRGGPPLGMQTPSRTQQTGWPHPDALEQPAPTFQARNRWGRRRRKDDQPPI